MNKTIGIYDPSGKLIRNHTFSANCVRKFSLMNEDSITLRFSSQESLQFPIGSYAGDFYITKEQVGKWNASTGVWDYELKFDAYYWLWANKILRYIIYDNNDQVLSALETSFTLTATINIHTKVITNCLKYLGFKFSNSPFGFNTNDTSLSKEAKLISYQNLSILGGIQAIAEAFDCEWWVKDNIIYLGRCENKTANGNGELISVSKHIFKAGINTLSLTFQQAKSETPNRLYVYGSDRNLPKNYREVDGNDTIGGIVAKRLMLPVGTPYLQTSENIPESQVVEKVVVLDSVYPRTELIVLDNPETYISEKDNEEGEIVSQTYYRLKYDDDFLFSENYVLPNEELHIIFQSGLLNGMDFGVRFNPKGLNEKDTNGNWNPNAQLFEIVANEDYGRMLPDDILKPKKYDKFILYGWDSTKMADLGLIHNAELELLEEGQKALAEYAKDLSTCTCPMAWDYMKPLFETNSEPKPGDIVTIIDTAHFGEDGRKSRIIGYEFKLDKPYAECTYTCGENISVKRLDSIEKKIEGLTKSGQKVQMQNSLDFLSKRFSDRTSYKLSADQGFEVGEFVAGSQGAMVGKAAESGKTFAEVDYLYARVKAYFESLTIIEANTLAGKQYITPGGSVKCTKVEEVKNAQGVTTAYKCYFLSEQDGEKADTKIIAGDQVISEIFNAKTGTANKVSNHRWWRLVTSVNQDAYTDDSGNHYGYIEVSASDCENGSDIPKEGDVIDQLGNRNEATRQTAIIIDTTGNDAPSIKMLSGINSFTLSDKAIISFGRDPLNNQVYFRLGTSSATQYLSYTQQGGLKLAGELGIGSQIDGKSVADYILDIAPDAYDDTVLMGIATGAQDAADNAQSTANSALGAAGGALSAANDAQQAADDAQNTANTAKSTADAAKETADSYKYLKESLLDATKGSTQISGGLILSKMIGLGYTDESNLYHLLSGMNGAYNDSLGARTPFLWGGGSMIDLFNPDGTKKTGLIDYATSMIRMDGTAYFSGGNIRFEKDYALFGSEEKGVKIGTDGSFTVGTGVKFNVSNVSGLKTTLNELADFNIGLSNLFKVVDTDGNLQPLSFAVTNPDEIASVKVMHGFFSDSFISARGQNPDGTSGGGVTQLSMLNDVLIGNNPQSGQSLVYDSALRKWVNQKAGLNTTELANYLIANNYAKLTDIPSLSGYAKLTDIPSLTEYATKEWVKGKGYITSSALSPYLKSADAANTYLTQSVYNTFKSGYDTWKADIDAFKATFESLFKKEPYGNGGFRIRARFGLYSDSFISARGLNGDASGGGGFGLLRSWPSSAPANTTTDALGANLGWELKTRIDNLPTTSVNPYSLTIQKNGTTLKTYDGSSAITANITFAFSDLTTHPTTLQGYGITDAVAAVQGKGLSTNDLTDTLLTKLNGIADGANKYVHPTATATNITASAGKVLSAITVDSLGHVTSVSSKTLAETDIPSLSISKINGLQNALDAKVDVTVYSSFLSTFATWQNGINTWKSGINNWKATVDTFITTFNKYFLLEGTTDATRKIKAKYGLYTDSFLSARGENPSQGSGTGSGFGLLRTWTDPSANPDDAFSAQVIWNKINSLPTTSVNPHALTIQKNGTTVKTYDGSSAVTANITIGWADTASGRPAWIGSSKPSYAFSEIGSKPTTLSGYGITDAKIDGGVITLGSDTVTPLVAADMKTLTFAAGTFSAKTYTPNSAAQTVNIPTSTSHITEGTRLYFTDARAQSALAATVSGLQADIAGKVSKAGDTMSGDLSFASIAAWPTPSTETYPIESKGLKWSGSSDTAEIFYRVAASDNGKLVMNMGDDDNPSILFEWKKVTSYTFNKKSLLASDVSATFNSLTIGDTTTKAHVAFSRGGYNYFTAPASGLFGFVSNGKAVGEANSDLIISNNLLRSGTNNKVSLGDSSHRWSNVYSVLGNFSGLITASAGIKIGDCLITWDGTGLKFSKGIYSEKFVSARGANSSGGTSGGGSYSLMREWDTAQNNKDTEYALGANLGWSLYTTKLNIDGSNGTNAGINTLIKLLGEASANVSDTTKILTSDINGDSGTLLYYRRPATSLWNYIKSKADSVYQPKGNYLTSHQALDYINVKDIRGAERLPSYYSNNRMSAWFNMNGTPNSEWWAGIQMKGWTNVYGSWQICASSHNSDTRNKNLYFRVGRNEAWEAWQTILTSANISSYAITSHQSLANYVTLNGAQTITGLKTFTGGISFGPFEPSDTNLIFTEVSGTKSSLVFKISDGPNDDFIFRLNKYNSNGNIDIDLLKISGNGIVANGSLAASSFIKSGGTSSQFLKADGSTDSTSYLPTSSYNASDVLTKLKTVDGSGSGLDADLLDGVHGSSYFKRQGRLGSYNIDKLTEFASRDIQPSSEVTISGNKPFNTWGTLLTFKSLTDNGGIQLASGDNRLYYRGAYNGTFVNTDWRSVAFLTDNVASATKLADNTAFTAWGQTFFTGGKPQTVTGSLTLGANNSIIGGNSVEILKDHGNSNVTLNASNGDLYIGYWRTSNVRFYSGNTTGTGTEKMTLLANGNVGIGTTAPAYDLDVNGTIMSNYLRVKLFLAFTKDSGNSHYLEVTDSNRRLSFCQTTDGSYKATRAWLSWGGVFYAQTGIYSDGYVSARGENTSDARLKTDIRPFNATDIIRSLNPVAFKWNATARSQFKVLDTDSQQYGLIAQETQNTAPWLVEKGTFGDDYLSIRYTKLIPVLAQAQKETTLRIDDLLIRVSRLESENRDLRRQLAQLKV